MCVGFVKQQELGLEQSRRDKMRKRDNASTKHDDAVGSGDGPSAVLHRNERNTNNKSASPFHQHHRPLRIP